MNLNYKEIFIDNQRIKTILATRKFNQLKIDWIPLWTNLEDLKEILKEVEGINGRFVDARWARGDKVALDSTQAILRYYKEENCLSIHLSMSTFMMSMVDEFL